MAYNIDRNGNLGTYGIGSSIGKDLIDAFGNPRADAEADARRQGQAISEFNLGQAKDKAERDRLDRERIKPHQDAWERLMSGDEKVVDEPDPVTGEPLYTGDKPAITWSPSDNRFKIDPSKMTNILGHGTALFGPNFTQSFHKFLSHAGADWKDMTPQQQAAFSVNGDEGYRGVLNNPFNARTPDQTQNAQNNTIAGAIATGRGNAEATADSGVAVDGNGNVLVGPRSANNPDRVPFGSPQPTTPNVFAAAQATEAPVSPALAGILAPGNRSMEDAFGLLRTAGEINSGTPSSVLDATPQPPPAGARGPTGPDGSPAESVEPEYPGVGPLIARQTIRKSDLTSQSSPKNTVPAGVAGEKLADGRTIYRRPAPVEGPTPAELLQERAIETGVSRLPTQEELNRKEENRGRWEAGLPKQIAALIANSQGRIPGGSGSGGASSVNTNLNPFVNAVAAEISSKAMELEDAGYSSFEARKLATDMTLAAYRKDVKTNERWFRQDSARLVSPGAGGDEDLSPSDVQTLIRSSNQANQGVLPSKAVLGQKYIDQELRYRGIDQDDLNSIPIKARGQIVQSMTHIAFIEDIIKRSALNGGRYLDDAAGGGRVLRTVSRDDIENFKAELATHENFVKKSLEKHLK